MPKAITPKDKADSLKSGKKSASGHGGPRPNSGGARPGAGRTSKAAMMGLKELLDEAWPRDQRVQALKKQAAAANSGDLDALKHLMSYTFGKPKEFQQVSAEVYVEVGYVDRELGPVRDE